MKQQEENISGGGTDEDKASGRETKKELKIKKIKKKHRRKHLPPINPAFSTEQLTLSPSPSPVN